MKKALILMITFICCWHVNTYAAGEYSSAKMLGVPDITSLGCKKGEFWDPRNGGECWSCSGADRTIFAVTGTKACQTPGGETLSKASQKSANISSCAGGSILDPRNGGECWSCLSGYERTLSAVTGKKACSKRIAKKNAKAKYSYNTGSVLKACKKGTFANVGSSKCYKCAKGYKHNGAKKVNKSGVCYKSAYTSYKTAAKTSSIAVSCPRGQIYDLINGGSCWTCPSGNKRTGNAVNSAKACSKAMTPKYAKAKKIKSANLLKGGCEADYGKSSFFDLAKGGSCWSCASSHPQRTLYGADTKKACASKTCGSVDGRPCLVWERIPSCNKGLMEDPFTNTCAKPKDFACTATLATIKEVKKINETLARKGREAQEEAINAIPGAREVIMYAQNQKGAMEEEVHKLINRIDIDVGSIQLVEGFEANSPEIERFLVTAANAAENANKIQAILLDPELVCTGDAKAAVRKIRNLGVLDQFVGADPALWRYLDPIPSAYASTPLEHSITFSLGVDLPVNAQLGAVQVTPGIGVSLAIGPGGGAWTFDFGASASKAEDPISGFGGNLGADKAPLGATFSIGWAQALASSGPTPAVNSPTLSIGLFDSRLNGCFEINPPNPLFCGLSIPLIGRELEVYLIGLRPFMAGGDYTGAAKDLWDKKHASPTTTAAPETPPTAADKKTNIKKQIVDALKKTSIGYGSSVNL
jgi:hypothetical protein